MSGLWAWLLTIWRAYFPHRAHVSPARPPLELLETDTMSRFLTSKKNHFSRAKNVVKPAAFLPPSDLQLSVFCTTAVPDHDLWRLGDEFVAKPRGVTVYGTGDITVRAVADAALSCDPNNDPPRHVNLIGWPKDDAAQLMIATKLASTAALRLRR